MIDKIKELISQLNASAQRELDGESMQALEAEYQQAAFHRGKFVAYGEVVNALNDLIRGKQDSGGEPPEISFKRHVRDTDEGAMIVDVCIEDPDFEIRHKRFQSGGPYNVYCGGVKVETDFGEIEEAREYIGSVLGN